MIRVKNPLLSLMTMINTDEISFSRTSTPLSGEVRVPGDKSLAHRALLFSALACGTSRITDFPDSGVTRAMMNALSALGIRVRLENKVLTVEGHGWRQFPNERVEVYCGNSATTLRLLAGAIVGTRSSATLTGSTGLCRRPMERIVAPLEQMGAKVCATNGCAPLEFAQSLRLNSINYTMPVASAQVKSCLILAALGAKGHTTITEPGPSRDHTELMLSAMGANISTCGHTITVAPLEKELSSLNGTLVGDISSAAFIFAAAAIVLGSCVTVRGICLNPTRIAFLEVLMRMGCNINIENESRSFGEAVGDVTLSAPDILTAVDISGDEVVRMIDEFPAFAAVAAFAQGVSTVRDARELRFKESDRIAAIVNNLRELSVAVNEFEDGFEVIGGAVKGGTVNAGGDHRLAMSLALMGLASNSPVIVKGASILNESYPEFCSTITQLLHH